MLSPRWLLLALVACAPPMRGTTAPPPSPPAPVVVAPAPPTIYAADEAVRDALSSPLVLVGIGGWPGYFRKLSCIYRNDRVIVTDVRCTRGASPRFEIVIYAPSRGRITMGFEANTTSSPRADYKAFGVIANAPWTGPLSLAAAKTYDDITAYDLAQGKTFPPTCTVDLTHPAGICSKNAPFPPSAFAAANTPFLQSPSEGWFTLVNALVARREAQYAAVDLGAMSADQHRAWGAALATDAEIAVNEDGLALVGNTTRTFAPIVATAEGGIAVIGVRELGRGGNVPAVLNLDRTGKRVWQTDLAEKGYRMAEVTSLLATPDGYVARVEGYVDHVLPINRLVKLDKAGKVKWKWFARERGRGHRPQVATVTQTERGTFVLSGHIQLEPDGPVHDWSAEVSATGKQLRDDVGAERK